jgi:hypothetical protein
VSVGPSHVTQSTRPDTTERQRSLQKLPTQRHSSQQNQWCPKTQPPHPTTTPCKKTIMKANTPSHPLVSTNHRIVALALNHLCCCAAVLLPCCGFRLSFFVGCCCNVCASPANCNPDGCLAISGPVPTGMPVLHQLHL